MEELSNIRMATSMKGPKDDSHIATSAKKFFDIQTSINALENLSSPKSFKVAEKPSIENL